MSACKHPKEQREHLDACVSRCKLCGLLYAMIAGKRSVRRRWVKSDDPAVAVGRAATERLLALARAKVLAP